MRANSRVHELLEPRQLSSSLLVVFVEVVPSEPKVVQWLRFLLKRYILPIDDNDDKLVPPLVVLHRIA